MVGVAYLGVYNCHFKNGHGYKKCDKSYRLSNAIIHFLTIGVYTFSKITMSPCPSKWYDNPTGSWTNYTLKDLQR
jgi:hypothetical protein